MRFGSLFAGVGGFDIGLEAAGWECGWQVEWDKNCQQTLAYHWPNVPKWLDVSDVNGAELPPVDVITFGSPCQDLSVAGKRAGIQQEGGRSNLFLKQPELSRRCVMQQPELALDGLYGKTSQELSLAEQVTTLKQSSKKWQTWGQVSLNGQPWMRSSSEYPNVEGEFSSSLALILQSPTEVADRYLLSPKAAEGILRRANRRGKTLPPRLQQALEQVAEKQ